MEGWNPTTGCTLRCGSWSGCRSSSGWVPAPRADYPRRDPFIDAVGRTDNPCERPARYPPCCKPVPKFRLPKEQPFCDINNYRCEQAIAKYKDCLEKQCQCCPSYCPANPCEDCPDVGLLDPDFPLIVQQEQLPSPEHVFHLIEQPCRTNIIAGFFNPDDNKTAEQKRREECDVFWRSCGSKLKPYPCRGVINYPPRRWISLAQENRACYPSICAGSKYISDEYIQQKQQEFARLDMEKRLNDNAAASKYRGCLNGRCGCD